MLNPYNIKNDIAVQKHRFAFLNRLFKESFEKLPSDQSIVFSGNDNTKLMDLLVDSLFRALSQNNTKAYGDFPFSTIRNCMFKGKMSHKQFVLFIDTLKDYLEEQGLIVNIDEIYKNELAYKSGNMDTKLTRDSYNHFKYNGNKLNAGGITVYDRKKLQSFLDQNRNLLLKHDWPLDADGFAQQIPKIDALNPKMYNFIAFCYGNLEQYGKEIPRQGKVFTENVCPFEALENVGRTRAIGKIPTSALKHLGKNNGELERLANYNGVEWDFFNNGECSVDMSSGVSFLYSKKAVGSFIKENREKIADLRLGVDLNSPNVIKEFISIIALYQYNNPKVQELFDDLSDYKMPMSLEYKEDFNPHIMYWQSLRGKSVTTERADENIETLKSLQQSSPSYKPF